MHKKKTSKIECIIHCTILHWTYVWTCRFASLGLYVSEISYVSSQRFSFYSILSWYVFLGESMNRLFDFYERVEQPFFRISRFLPYSSLHSFFYVTCLRALMWIVQYSYFFLFSFWLISFCYSIWLCYIRSFFLFSSHSMLDLDLAFTCSCSSCGYWCSFLYHHYSCESL